MKPSFTSRRIDGFKQNSTDGRHRISCSFSRCDSLLISSSIRKWTRGQHCFSPAFYTSHSAVTCARLSSMPTQADVFLMCRKTRRSHTSWPWGVLATVPVLPSHSEQIIQTFQRQSGPPYFCGQRAGWCQPKSWRLWLLLGNTKVLHWLQTDRWVNNSKAHLARTSTVQAFLCHNTACRQQCTRP